METRITEQSSHYDHLEQMTVEQITEGINNESMSVAVAVGKALPQLNSLISAIFPGGTGCLTQTRESREDDLQNGWEQLTKRGVSVKDIVVGFSASGTTPFVLATLKRCREAGIATGCIVNNPDSPISREADYAVEVITGPEFVTGSTRMKAGTSQKMCLDMISTTVEIRLGRVEGNKMVNAKLINAKLIDRAVRIFMERNPQITDRKEAERLILQAGSVKKAEEM